MIPPKPPQWVFDYAFARSFFARRFMWVMGEREILSRASVLIGTGV